MSKSLSKIREADKKAARLLCASFNESMRNGSEYKAAMVKMVASQKQFIPAFRSLDANSVLATSNLQMNVLLPHEMRRNVTKLIVYLINKYINPALEPVDCFLFEAFIDEQILPAKEWVQ